MNNFENAEYPPKGEYGTSAGSVKQSKLNKPEKVRDCFASEYSLKRNQTIDEMDAYYKQFIKREVESRIKYQDIVYKICLLFDSKNNKCLTAEVVGKVTQLINNRKGDYRYDK